MTFIPQAKMVNPTPQMISGIGNNIRLSSHLAPRTSHVAPAFTLIELMISVVILGIGLVAVIQSFLSSVSGLNTAGDYVEALRVAQDKFTELELSSYENKGLLSDLDSKSGAGFLGSREFNWVSEVKEISKSDYLTEKLVEVCIKLNWKERNVTRDVSLASYLPKRKEE